MNIQFRQTAKFDQPAVLVLLTQDQVKKKDFRQVASQGLREMTARLVQKDKFLGEARQVLPVIDKDKVILLVGVGEEKKLTPTELRVIVRQAVTSAYLKKITAAELITFDQKDETIAAVIDGIVIGGYSWKKYKTENAKDPAKTIYVISARKVSFAQQVVTDEGVNLARDLVNDNADLVTAQYFEKVIRGLTKGERSISLEVLGRRELTQKGLNLLLAVNQGSVQEPRLIIARYHGDRSSGDYTAVIGKGITFDTGGLNLKTSSHIESMRSDMSGAAAVAALLKNTLALKLKKNIIFAVAMAENAIGSRAYKPGDVFRSYSGKTVEILNTDAEGRLVLADAIAYVAKNYKPGRIIDVATLTGACVIALGYDYTGLMATDNKLAEALLAAGHATDDRVWRLPTYPELKEAVKSEIADIKNTGFPKGAAGTLTGGEFLRQFTDDIPWAHLDIAGTSFMEGQGRLYYSYGATGAGVRLLTRYLQDS